jgi:hypothetical protein
MLRVLARAGLAVGAVTGEAEAWWAPSWLRQRAEGQFAIHLMTTIEQAQVKGNKVTLLVSEAGVGEHKIEADYVLAGTRYEVDVDRFTFISKDLAGQIRRIERAPRLSRHFESSVPGLYFIGPVAAFSFGPLVRFVAGSEFAVRVLARHLAFQISGLGAAWRRLAQPGANRNLPA